MVVVVVWPAAGVLSCVLVVEPGQVGRTIELIRARLPMAATSRIPKPAELLHTGPLRQAIQSLEK